MQMQGTSLVSHQGNAVAHQVLLKEVDLIDGQRDDSPSMLVRARITGPVR